KRIIAVNLERGLPGAMTRVTAVRRDAFGVTGDATGHVCRLLFEHRGTRGDRSMARLAFELGFLDVYRMRKPNEVRDGVDPCPGRRCLRPREFGQLPDGRTVLLDGDVAAHANDFFR